MTTIDAHNLHWVPTLAAQPRPPVAQGLSPHDTQAQSGPHRGPDGVVELSTQATDAAAAHQPDQATSTSQTTNPDHVQQSNLRKDQAQDQAASHQTLTQEEQKQVQQLKERDRQVRQHEAAHKAAAGQYAQGQPTFDFQTGPDGKQYAIGGEVQIDTSPVKGDPRATIRKMQVIQQAALAPGDPSPQDRAVAAQAARVAQQARMQLNQKSDQGSQPASTERSVDPAGPGATQDSERSSHDATVKRPTGLTTIGEHFSHSDIVAGQRVDLAA